MRFSQGQLVGRYVIESLLGEGGMGEVYRAQDSLLERNVALKVLRNQTEDAADEWNVALMRMQREAKAVAALSHANIVAVYDVGEHEGSPYIAMELVVGKSLRELIGTDLPMGSRLRLLLDVARALEAAHEANIIHRDIKPENILVRQDGTAKVLDFGIARRTSSPIETSPVPSAPEPKSTPAAFATVTVEGAMVGTPAYMAPEQLRGEPIDARADQFAWGVVAYELISGKHPFHAEKGGATLLASILSDTPEPLTGVSEGVAAIVSKTLEKQPEDRWASMHELVEQCAVFVTSDELRKVTPTPGNAIAVERNATTERTHPSPTHSRRKWIAATLGLALVGSLIAVGVHRGQSSNAPLPATKAVPEALPAGPILLTDLPIPASDSLAAKAAFREGLQAIRDARWSVAIAAFDHARSEDPGMAAAHMRYAFVRHHENMDAAIEALRRAMGLRTSLSTRDQRLLNAIEPIIVGRARNDYITAAQRIAELVEQQPSDVELLFWQAHIQMKINTAESRARAVEISAQCTKLDPRYADCWQIQAFVARNEGDFDRAGAALDQCVNAAENALDCLQDKIQLDAQVGRCSTVVDSLRRLRVKEPSATKPLEMLAHASYLLNAPEATVRLAIEQASAGYRQTGHLFAASELVTFAAIGYGDFDAAIRETDTMAAMPAPVLYKEMALVLLRVDLRRQMGDVRGAVALVDEYSAKLALRPQESSETGIDPRIVMNAIKLEAGTMSKRDYEAARTAWLTSHTKDPPGKDGFRWYNAYAAPAYSKEMAEAALMEATHMLRKPPEKNKQQAFLTERSKLLLLAGRPAEALPLLEKATNICLQTYGVMAHVVNMARLGMARQAVGDKPGACQAYQWVLDRWSKSPQPMTAKDVAKRAKALGCEG